MEFTKETTQGKADSKKQHAGLLHEFSGSHASIKDNRHATVVQARQKQEARHSDRTAHQQQMFSSAIGKATHNSNRVKPILQWQNGTPVNDNAALEKEAGIIEKEAGQHLTAEGSHAGKYTGQSLSHRLDAHMLERSYTPVTHSTYPVQRVPIPPEKKEDTTKTKPDAALLKKLSVIGLINFWREVYWEGRENSMEWRLAICHGILVKLKAQKYGAYDTGMLNELSKEEVNTGMESKENPKRTPGTFKSVAFIKVAGHDLAAARMQKVYGGNISDSGDSDSGDTEESQDKKDSQDKKVNKGPKNKKLINMIENEVAMLQILTLIGVRTPRLYGTRESDSAPLDLYKDKIGKLNIVMDRVMTNQKFLNVWTSQVGALYSWLTVSLNSSSDKDAFDQKKKNMLTDLRWILRVSEVLTICDLQILIEDKTGHVVVFDPGAIVPRGKAPEPNLEKDTYANLQHACKQLEALKFDAPKTGTEVKESTNEEIKKNANEPKARVIPLELAEKIAGSYSNVDKFLKYLHHAITGTEVNDVTQVDITKAQIEASIMANARVADLGDVIGDEEIESAVSRLIALGKKP